jgi:drug/metabolite transporter (DMT)-like permease
MPYISLAAGVLSIGMSAILIRSANAPGVVSVFYRMAIGAILMGIPFTVRVKHQPGTLSQKGIALAVLAGFFFSLDMVFWSTGIMLSGATIPTLLANTAPLWVGLGSWLVLRESQNLKFWFGLVIATLGAFWVLGIDMSRSPQLGLGAWFGIFSAFFYGAYHIASQRGRRYLSTLSYFWVSTTVSAFFLLFYALILKAPLIGYGWQTWRLFLLMGILVQVLGWMFINYAQGHLRAAVVSPTLLAQPLMTAIFAGILLGEQLTTPHLIGGILVLSGVFLVHRSNHTGCTDREEP